MRIAQTQVVAIELFLSYFVNMSQEELSLQVDQNLSKAVKDMIHNHKGETVIETRIQSTLIRDKYFEVYPPCASEFHLVDVDPRKVQGINISDFQVTLYSKVQQNNGRIAIDIDYRLVRNVVFQYYDDDDLPSRDDFSSSMIQQPSFLPAIMPAPEEHNTITSEQDKETRKGFGHRVRESFTSLFLLFTCCCGVESGQKDDFPYGTAGAEAA